MTVTVVDPPRRPAPRAGIAHRVHIGQVVGTQAAVTLWLLFWGRGPAAVTVASLIAVAVLLLLWVPAGGRWLYQWLGLLLRSLFRRRTLGAGAAPEALLAWIAPGTRVVAEEFDGQPVGVIEDVDGSAVLLDLGNPAAVLADAPVPLPALWSLLAPGIRLHLVLTGVPAAFGAGTAAASYRQLTDGRLLAAQRAVLAIRVRRSDGLSMPHGMSEEELRHSLTSAARRIRRRLPDPLGARLLAAPVAKDVLAELAHHDDAQPAAEGWRAVQLGGLAQTTYQLRVPAQASVAVVIQRLLALPATAVTVGLTAGPGPRFSLAVRLAAATPAALTIAGQALYRVLEGQGVGASRLDGGQLPALAATLPTATGHSGQPTPREQLATLEQLSSLTPAIGGAGLVVGIDRHGAPLIARLFRPEPTRALLVGGVPATQLLTLRAVAVGARVVVQTARPQAWEAFVRAVSAPGEAVAVVPPGRPAPVLGAAGTALRPQLVVVDAGAAGGTVAGEVPVPAAPWRTALVVRDEVTAADLDLLARCDLAVLQPLTGSEATLVTTALGLSSVGDWLNRIRDDMVAVVSRAMADRAVNRRTVHWALLSATEVERQLLGTVSRP